MFNAPEKLPPIDEATQALFDQGHEVGDFAKKLYPVGVEVPFGKNSVKITEDLLGKRVPIFEASFAYKNAYCKTDILVPVDKDEWDLIEVKSSSSVKEEHIADTAFQLYCLAGAGLKIRRIHLMHINNEYVRHGSIDPKKLFTAQDITPEATEILPTIEDKIGEQLAIIQGPMPEPALGTECLAPKDCPVHSADLPEVLELYRIGKKAYELTEQGIKLIQDIPTDFELNDKQRIQRDAAVTGKAHIEPAQIKKFLKELKYPLYLLDFEAVNPAIPLFDGTSPFQAIPFQLSLHIVEKPATKPKHVEFLADGPEDPRSGIVEALKAIGPKGTILAYNMSYEKRVIEDLAEAFPKQKHLKPLIERFNDPIIPFRNFWYYDPQQHGSNSIKAVLPALTGRSYAHLEVSTGDEAARKFLQMTYKGKQMSAGEKAALRKALLIYCKQDTEAMIEILGVLEKV